MAFPAAPISFPIARALSGKADTFHWSGRRRRGNIMTRGNHPLNNGAISVENEVTVFSFWTGDYWSYDPQFVYDNWFLDGSNGAVETITDGTNTLTDHTLYGHGIRWSGQALQMQYDNAAIVAGSTRICTPFYGLAIPPRTQVFVHTWKKHVIGGRRTNQYYPYSGKGEGASFTSSNANAQAYFDGTTPIPAADTSVGSGPSMVVATTSAPALLAVGTSLTDGSNDDALADGVAGMRTGGDAYWNRGFISRGVGSLMGCAVHRMNRGGAKFEAVIGSGWTRRKALYQALGVPFDRILVELGTNNLGEPDADLKTKSDAVIAELKAAFPGVPVHVLGMFPGSSSTDGYATLVNQTRRSNYTSREAMRDHWAAQALAGTIAGFLDPSTYISGTGADLWKWLPIGGPTSDDGTHYVANGAGLLAEWLRQNFQMVPYVAPAGNTWGWPSGDEMGWPSGDTIGAI
jgi:hypothetical protein